MTNLVSILKHCPEGTKLYSPVYGEVVLDSVQSKSIYTLAKTNNGSTLVVEFTPLGRLHYEFSNSECILFPSKDQRDWDKFRIPTKKGDVIMFNGQVPCLVTGDYSRDKKKWVCGLLEDDDFCTNIIHPSEWNACFYTFATKEIKAKLFKAMDKAGYTWNGETLKKKKPQLKPFDKVLVRDSNDVPWTASYYSHKEEGSYPYITIGNLCFKYCIPLKEMSIL